MIRKIKADGVQEVEFLAKLGERSRNTNKDVTETVSEIINNVMMNGDKAVREYTIKFDGKAPDAFEVPKEELTALTADCDPEFIATLKKAADNIRNFHERQKQQSWLTTKDNGVIMGQRIRGLKRVGLYVPGGTAAYPSSVLMNAIPAKIAGVSELIMVTPPGKDGKPNPDIMAAAAIAGVDRVFLMGGAQAVAALAYGTESVPKVDKIVGPGNIFVATAKKLLYGTVDIDMIAGPSEILVLADESANPKFLAADLMSQAEHDKLASAILITTSDKLAEDTTKETDQLVNNFNASISFDQKFYRQDIRGSIAHATMLGKQGIISEDESKKIVDGLNGILSDIESGKLEITDEYEDIHTFMEATLIERIGDTGKKLHTGRSRNDQVALDMRLYTRDEVLNVNQEVKELMEVILKIMKENTETYMPGFTHLQKAQPVTVAHHFGAYFEMFKRDRSRLHDIYERMNYCPLGAGALAGTTYPLDRELTASLLDFYGPTLNSMDSVSDRDYLIEFLNALSTIMMHLSRFSEEICIWNSNEYKFIELDDAYSTGSSIMPQKKNPDIAELVRGKTGRVYGALMSLLTTMKGIPLAYNKDMQEDKELSFDAIDTVKGCVSLFKGMIATMRFNPKRMEDSAKHGFTNATDAADYLVKKGVPFRDAHGIVGQLVLTCIEKGIALDDLTLDEYKAISPVFEQDIYDAISLKTCVEKRLTLGAPGPDVMKQVIEKYEEYLLND